jgi:hypothetical protein
MVTRIGHDKDLAPGHGSLDLRSSCRGKGILPSENDHVHGWLDKLVDIAVKIGAITSRNRPYYYYGIRVERRIKTGIGTVYGDIVGTYR